MLKTQLKFQTRSEQSGANKKTALQTTYENDISKEGGFLPSTVPVYNVPTGFAGYQEVCRHLPDNYHGNDAHTRPWMDDLFAGWDPDLTQIIDASPEAEQHALMTVLSILAHAYRWDSLPASQENYDLTSIDLPPGIQEPWSYVARKLSVPRVGTMYYMVFNNWQLKEHHPGDVYLNEDLIDENLRLGYSWLHSPDDEALRAFVAGLVVSEAKGAPALETIVNLVSAAERKDTQESIYLLDKLQTDIQEIVVVFNNFFQQKRFTPLQFRTLLQPTFIWGIGSGEDHFDGANDAQLGILQALDLALGVSRESAMGKQVRLGRKYMPLPHRRFLSNLEAVTSVVRDFVQESNNLQLTRNYNACLKNLHVWRNVQQKRGALYLRDETIHNDGDADVDTVSDDLVARFEGAMEGNIRETVEAQLPVETVELATLDTTFKYLTQEDSQHLLLGAKPVRYEKDALILKEGSRRQGIFIIRSGTVRVTRNYLSNEVAYARLGPGELFGEMSFLENEPTVASIRADGVCEIDHIDREHVYDLLSSQPGFATRFYQSLATFLSNRLRPSIMLLPELLLNEQPAARRLHISRTNPDDTSALPALVENELNQFNTVMENLERDLTQSSVKTELAQQKINKACTKVISLLRRYSGTKSASSRNVQNAIFRETFRWLMRSELIDRIYQRPRGFAGDFTIFECMNQADARGDGQVGPLIDKWFRTLPTIRSLVNVPHQLAHLLRLQEHDQTPITVTWLAYGPGKWLLDTALIQEIPPLDMTCVDLDHATCAFGLEKAKTLGLPHRVQVAQDNIVRLARGTGRVRILPQQVICIDALLHYLSDEEAVSVLDWVYDNLETGGQVLVVNFNHSSPDRPFFDYVLDWDVRLRTADELDNLFTYSKFGADPMDIELDDAGVAFYASCTKR